MDIFVVLNTMVELFIVLVIGYFISKAGILDEKTTKKLSSLVVQVTCPLLIISSVVNSTVTGDKGQVFKTLLLGFLFYVIIFPIFAWVIGKVMMISENQKGIYQFMVIFGNTSFMGFPVVQAVFGTNSIFQMSLFNMPFNILVFSYGIYLIAKDGSSNMKFEIKKLLNPGIISSVLALIVYMLKIPFPTVIKQTLYSVGGLTTPLSMLILGASLVQIPIKEVVEEKKVFLLTALKILLMPILTYYGLKFFISDPLILGIATLSAAMPIASMSVMLSNEYGGNSKVASISVFISTLASVISIPTVAYVLFK